MAILYYLKYYYYYLQSQFVGYPFIIKLTVFLVLIFIFIYVFSMFRSVFLHRKERRHTSFYKRLKKHFDRKFEDIFYNSKTYSDLELRELVEEDIDLVTKVYHKKVFTDYVVDFVERFQHTKVMNIENYQGVLIVFAIIEFWSKRVVSNSSKKRRIALRSLEDLNIGLTGSTIMRSTYHKNNSLRKHARATLIKHDKNNPYQFLESDFDEDFNKLDEVRLHYFFSEKYEEGVLPQLIRWVKLTQNEDFKIYLISEIGFFQQKDAAPMLYEMLLKDDQTDPVNCGIIESLGKLNYFKAESYIIENFEFYNRKLQLSAINSLSILHTSTALDFLTQVYFLLDDYSLKIHTAQAISRFGKKGVQALYQMNQQAVLDFDKKVFDQFSYQIG